MSDTWAVPLDMLAAANRTSTTGQPLCPACKFGRLHPYRVEMSLSDHPHGWHGANYLEGWVAVCVGDGMWRQRRAELRAEAGEPADDDESVEQPTCGFSMPMTPRRYPRFEHAS